MELLILTGNPCCEYEGYREYVIATLPQLKELDNKQIERSERIKALQRYAEAQGDVIRGYANYLKFRQKQKTQFQQRVSESQSSVKITEIKDGEDPEDENEENEDQEDEEFWKSKSYHTPEDRILLAQKTMSLKEKHESNKSGKKKDEEGKKEVKFFSPAGKPYNMNQPKIPFDLNDEFNRDNIILEVHIYK